MEVFHAVGTVRAIRRFADRPVPGDAVAKILEAGRLTASAVNKQPWHFIVVKDRHRLGSSGSAWWPPPVWLAFWATPGWPRTGSG
jgi:nitroreductase